MSRTKRAKRPRYYGTAKGTVRDGAPQHATASCDNNGACNYCVDNRTHKHKRRAPA